MSSSRPPSISLSLRSLLTFPMRLCSPPPSASRVRSCKVTPLLKVSLDDVLNKRHLPPLTLKDFEEWLVFVEGNPQYLYFILWLKEYEVRYAAWLAESGCTVPKTSSAKFTSPSTSTFGTDPDPDSPCHPHPRDRDLSYLNLIPSSPALALFFTRAKQTFLDPASNSPYSLSQAALLALSPSTHSLSPSIPHFTVPDDITPHGTVGGLPSHIATQPHPHPKELVPLAIYARKVLKESLERFSATACHNVGSRRALCGIVGGLLILLVMGVLPTLVTIFYASSRWWRIVGWAGCWLGGTVIITSFHGICMMIYVFGDLRQLRSFELARPTISNPRAIARARPKLKSIFTRYQDGQATSGNVNNNNPGSGPHSETTPNPSQISPQSPPAMLAVPTKKNNKKGHFSAATVSETSTGTPVVHFGPGAFRLGNGTATMESDVSGATDTDTETGRHRMVGHFVVGNDDDDDDGIVISPEYYYPGQGPDDMADSNHRESTGTGSKIGYVLRWMLGRRQSRSSGGGGGTATVEIGSAVLDDVVTRSEMSEKTSPHIQSFSQRSHAGTFGIRSWRGGLGGLYEADGDIERGGCGCHGCDRDGICDDVGVEDEDDVGSTFTAEFITHDYPPIGPERDPEAVIPSIAIVPSTPLNSQRGSGNSPAHTVDGNLNVNPTPTNKEKDGDIHAPITAEKESDARRMSSPSLPVKFDFDKLPVRRLSSPCVVPIPDPLSPSTPNPPTIAIRRERTPPQPLQLAIPPTVHTRPAIFAPTLTSPTPSHASYPPSHISAPPPTHNISNAISVSPPLHDIKARQWWDTCPRHPLVEATLARGRAAHTNIDASGNTHICPTSKQLHPGTQGHADAMSMRAISPSSSDVHSRVRGSGRNLYNDIDTTAPSSSSREKSHLHSYTYAHPHSRPDYHSRSYTATAVLNENGNKATWRDRFRRVTSVPAFGPLTRVLEPVVSRGQWEVVVRSGLIAALSAWIFIGSLLALPEARRL